MRRRKKKEKRYIHISYFVHEVEELSSEPIFNNLLYIFFMLYKKSCVEKKHLIKRWILDLSLIVEKKQTRWGCGVGLKRRGENIIKMILPAGDVEIRGI